MKDICLKSTQQTMVKKSHEQQLCHIIFSYKISDYTSNKALQIFLILESKAATTTATTTTRRRRRKSSSGPGYHSSPSESDTRHGAVHVRPIHNRNVTNNNNYVAQQHQEQAMIAAKIAPDYNQEEVQEAYQQGAQDRQFRYIYYYDSRGCSISESKVFETLRHSSGMSLGVPTNSRSQCGSCTGITKGKHHIHIH